MFLRFDMSNCKGLYTLMDKDSYENPIESRDETICEVHEMLN